MTDKKVKVQLLVPCFVKGESGSYEELATGDHLVTENLAASLVKSNRAIVVIEGKKAK
tara:strand:+ start:3642 stop:3815 length:174 start_codon:yes stop_codon:yes gene_type:complete